MESETVSALASLLTSTVTLIGILFIYFQLRATRQSIEAQTRASVASKEMEIQKVIMENPSLRSNFFSQTQPAEGSDEANRVIMLCAIYCDFYEYFLSEETRVGYRTSQAYSNFAKHLINNSPVFHHFFETNRRYYSKELGDFFDSLK